MAYEDQHLFTHVPVRVDRQLFAAPDSDYKVYGMKVTDPNYDIPLDSFGGISVSGEMANFEDGSVLDMDLVYDENASRKFNRPSFTVHAIHYGLPKDAEGQWHFLAQITRKSKSMYEKLSDALPPTAMVLDMIVDEKLTPGQVKGIGAVTLAKLHDRIKKSKDLGILMGEYGEGLTPIAYQRIYDHFLDAKRAIHAINKNPYIIIAVGGIGFQTADKFALARGVKKDDPDRIKFGMHFAFESKVLNSAHTFASLDWFTKTCTEMLDIEPEVLAPQLDPETALKNDFIVNVDQPTGKKTITTSLMFLKEADIYKLIGIAEHTPWPILPKSQLDQAIADFQRINHVVLNHEQIAFLQSANVNGITILNGSAGTGKTWIVKVFVDIMRRNKVDFSLLAPTGRAAKVLQAYTQAPAKTIHSRLRLLPGFETKPYRRFSSNRGTFGDQDFVVVDESSMVTEDLAWELVRAVDYNEQHLIFVGDAFQLPAIGPGNFLNDLATAKQVATVTLTHVYRQGEKSGILDLATRVRELAPMPFYRTQETYVNGALKMYNRNDAQGIADILVQRYRELWEAHDRSTDTIMLCVNQNRGALGQRTLNRRIQTFVTPPQPGEAEYVSPVLDQDTGDKDVIRLNDKVMILKNDGSAELVDPETWQRIPNTDPDDDSENDDSSPSYETTSVTNGDLGRVAHIDTKHRFMVVQVEDEYVYFAFAGLLQKLALAYAVTVYKAQGGQADHVLLGFGVGGFMVDAQSFYTALTRAKESVDCYADFGMLRAKLKVVPRDKRHDLLGNFLSGRLNPDTYALMTADELRKALDPKAKQEELPVPQKADEDETGEAEEVSAERSSEGDGYGERPRPSNQNKKASQKKTVLENPDVILNRAKAKWAAENRFPSQPELDAVLERVARARRALRERKAAASDNVRKTPEAKQEEKQQTKKKHKPTQPAPEPSRYTPAQQKIIDGQDPLLAEFRRMFGHDYK